MFKKAAADLLNAINECTCSFTTVLYAKERLKKADFKELSLKDMAQWKIEKGDKVYINIYDSSLFAFTVGKDIKKDDMLRIVASHTDSPALYLKPNPEIRSRGYLKVNVEIYGGAILNTWLDRPLSMAGKLALKGNDIFNPETVIVDFKKKLFTIPNLAIHLNREINKGVELNRQIDMLPVCAVLEDKLNENNFFMEYIAKELNVKAEDILDYELYIYNAEDGCILGLDEEMISAPRLDNITSVEASLNAIIKSERSNGINGVILYDNEEIGSRSKQGADSQLLSMVLERLYDALGFKRADFLNAITNGFLLSADVSHALHPNHSEKADVTNINMLNKGTVIKRACSQTYGTDCQSIAVIEQICDTCNISYQKFASRSDVTTGSTLGSIANKYLPMRVVDIGVPVLAMHSARETMGLNDQYNIQGVMEGFFR